MDGSQQGIKAKRALETILGGKEPPKKEEERPPEWWLKYLTDKDDDIDSYNKHAEVMAKYIIKAYQEQPGLQMLPNETIYMKPVDWNNPVILVPSLSTVLKEKVYADENHPFRQALHEATGFTWGWAFNIARYALGLPPQPNPAIVEI
jgi:hypothetical protein